MFWLVAYYYYPLPTVSVFYSLSLVDNFYHDRPAFSVSGHLWVDPIDALFSRSIHIIVGRGFVPVTSLLSVRVGYALLHSHRIFVVIIVCVSSLVNGCRLLAHSMQSVTIMITLINMIGCAKHSSHVLPQCS